MEMKKKEEKKHIHIYDTTMLNLPAIFLGIS